MSAVGLVAQRAAGRLLRGGTDQDLTVDDELLGEPHCFLAQEEKEAKGGDK